MLTIATISWGAVEPQRPSVTEGEPKKERERSERKEKRGKEREKDRKEGGQKRKR